MSTPQLHSLLVGTAAGRSLDLPPKEQGRLRLVSYAVANPALALVAARSMAASRRGDGKPPIDPDIRTDEDRASLLERAEAAARTALEAKEAASAAADRAEAAAREAEAARAVAEEARNGSSDARDAATTSMQAAQDAAAASKADAQDAHASAEEARRTAEAPAVKAKK